MKTLLFFIIAICFSIELCAQIVNIPDPVFKQALLDHGFNTGVEIDTNFDGEIQLSEAQAITGMLNVNGQFIDIQDLTGIEAFVNITELNVWQNLLTTLDLSQNTALVSLFCNDNPLSSLNISQCANLEILWSNDTQLTSLDVSTNINLEQIIIYNNLLVNLDVSTNINLQTIRCNDNLLASLDVSNNINLQGNVSCKNNLLTYLDVRNGNNNNITFFDAGGNPNLTCIFVDDAIYSEANWFRDPASTFVETEAACDKLGVDDNFMQSIKVYPNPVNEILYIDNSDFRFQNLEFKIIDITAKTIYQSKISNQQSLINISSLQPGVYFLQFYSKDSSIVVTKKFIKL